MQVFTEGPALGTCEVSTAYLLKLWSLQLKINSYATFEDASKNSTFFSGSLKKDKKEVRARSLKADRQKEKTEKLPKQCGRKRKRRGSNNPKGRGARKGRGRPPKRACRNARGRGAGK